jgi:hypothetical protein
LPALFWGAEAKAYLHAGDWLELRLLVGSQAQRGRTEYVKLVSFFQIQRPGTSSTDNFSRVDLYMPVAAQPGTVAAADASFEQLRFDSATVMPISLGNYEVRFSLSSPSSHPPQLVRLVRVLPKLGVMFVATRGLPVVIPPSSTT